VVLRGIDRLIALGCHVDACNPAGVTALMLAARRSSPVLAVELMQRGADDTRVTALGWTAWTYAVKWGSIHVLREMFGFKVETARRALSGPHPNPARAAALACNQFGLDHPNGKSTTLNEAVARGVETGDFAALRFFIERDCDLTCLTKVRTIVSSLLVPRSRPRKITAATSIQRWFTAVSEQRRVNAVANKGANSTADDTTISLTATTTAVDSDDGVNSSSSEGYVVVDSDEENVINTVTGSSSDANTSPDSGINTSPNSGINTSPNSGINTSPDSSRSSISSTDEVSSSLSAPAPPPRSVPPPPAPPLPPHLTSSRCSDSVAVAALLLRVVAEQAEERMQKTLPQRKLLARPQGDA
jgi:hypothetical protein